MLFSLIGALSQVVKESICQTLLEKFKARGNKGREVRTVGTKIVVQSHDSLRRSATDTSLPAWARLSAHSRRYDAVLDMVPRQYSMVWIAWWINTSPNSNYTETEKEREPVEY